MQAHRSLRSGLVTFAGSGKTVLTSRALLCGLACALLASCNGVPTSFSSSGAAKAATQGKFQAQYLVARDALEAGDYKKAGRSYAKLISVSQAAPLVPRLRLEYAHTLLRAQDFGAAATEARAVSAILQGSGRAAALAVQGTAEHEIGLRYLAKGDTAKGAQLLRSADAAMAAVLKDHADMDPLGSLAARRASIAVRLKSL